MKYISLDIETTSLTPSPDNILQVAMVAEDSDKPDVPVEELPHFVCLVSGPTYTGEAFALQMNASYLRAIALGDQSVYPIYSRESWPLHALEWLVKHGDGPRLNVAGKNVAGFDLQFMPPEIRRRFRHRALDVGSLFVDWTKPTLPSLEDLKTVYLDDPFVAHDALEDARDVIRVLRKSYLKPMA